MKSILQEMCCGVNLAWCVVFQLVHYIPDLVDSYGFIWGKIMSLPQC